MKKVVYIFAFALLLLVGSTAFAAPFNPAGDCDTVSIGNKTTGAGMPGSSGSGGAGCGWFSTNVSASDSQMIHVHIYYHNASTANATNTRVSLTQSPSGSGTNFSFSGTVSSDQGSSSGSSSLSLSTAQTVTLTDVAWYPNQTGPTGQRTALPNGQSGSSILSGGVNIGTVAPGWNSQGEFTLTFVVGSAPVVVTPTTCQIINFNASPQNGTSGQPVTLTWNTIGTNSVVVDGTSYPGGAGSKVVYPYATQNYYMTANCTNGTTISSQTQVVVNTPVVTTCQINRFTANPQNITYSGQAVTLYWDTIGANSVFVDGTTYYTSSGSAIVYPSSNRTYYIRANCNNGSQVDRDVTVNVNYINTYTGLTLNTNVATNITQTSATLNGLINANGNNATRWFRYGTTSGSMYLTTNIVNHGTGSGSVSDYVTNLSPNTTYYFQVVASDSQGTHYEANIQSFNTNASIINTGSTSAVTTVATSVTNSTAQINGLLVNSTSYATSTYFEYGTTVTMGSRTVTKQMGLGTSVPLSDVISGLTPNTIYYFRANAENAKGRVYGTIEIFRTPGIAVPAPVVNTVITRVGAESPIMLKIENRYEIFRIGDIVDYTVTYKNIGKSTLTNPLLQVILPAHVAYTNSSRGTYAVDTNTLSVPLETLTPGAGGQVFLQGRVISLPENHSQIVTTALLAYTNTNGAQENAMAYVLNRDDGTNNNLAANALFATGWWPTTLCGWLLLIIIILGAILLIRYLLARRDEKTRVVYRNNNHL